MCYNISVIQGRPSYESLPALKLIHFPKGNCYKPFTQVKPATDGKNLYLEVLVFEAHPAKGSSVLAVFKNGEQSLFINCTPTTCTCTRKQAGAPQETLDSILTVHHFDGEDLQGIYWGVDITLPLDSILSGNINKDAALQGNFYKYSKEEQPHNGALFPCENFEDFSCEANLGTLKFVNY